MTKSAYFAKMFDGPFEEANAASVTIDEEPALFVHVIEFLYLNEYTETTCLTDVPASGHGQFWGIKDVYRERHPIFLHIDLFHFADIFTITGLKQEAGERFARHWFTSLHPGQQQNPPVTFSDLDADVIKAVYELPLTDSRLRDIVVLGQKCNMEAHQILDSVKYTDVIKAIPEFALDLIRKPLIRPQCRCLKCGSTQPVLWEKCVCGSWDDCGFYVCISKLVEKMQCYQCGQFGFSYSSSQPDFRTIHCRRGALGRGAPMAGPYAGVGTNPYYSTYNYTNTTTTALGAGGAGGMGLGGGIAGALGHAAGIGGQLGGHTGFQQGPGNLAQTQVHVVGAPIPVGVATVSPWTSDLHSSDSLGSKQD